MIQAVATFKFYKLTNKALATSINSQFTSYLASTQYSYPFLVTAVGINIHYPSKTMTSNETLGVKLLKETSKLQQLNTELALLNSNLAIYQPYINNYTTARVLLP